MREEGRVARPPSQITASLAGAGGGRGGKKATHDVEGTYLAGPRADGD